MGEENAPNKRKSISDLREELIVAFQQHEATSTNQHGDPVVPAKFIASLLSTFCTQHDVALLTPAETASLENVTSTIPDYPITADELLQFITMAPVVSASPSSSPDTSFEESDSEERGRHDSRAHNTASRSSSNDSSQTSYYVPGKGRYSDSSIPPNSSPFESESRQRSLPLQNVAPTSYKRPTAPGRRRRRSEGGSVSGLSDSESSVAPNFGHRARVRAPSNPTSPSWGDSSFQNTSFPASPTAISDGSSTGVRSPDTSLVFPSQAHRGSPNQLSHEAAEDDFDDPDDSTVSIDRLLNRSIDSDRHDGSDNEVSSILDVRTNASSFSSFTSPEERLDALQRVNSELNRKIQENERQFQRKLADMESEMEELQIKLEETKSELISTRKEEKDLRQKEKNSNTQIRSFESQVHKLQKSLESSKATYQNLQKQYSEQVAESERTRKALLQKDNDIRDLQMNVQAHHSEFNRYKGEKDLLESRYADLEQELAAARELQTSLDDQKQENLMLKETINRLRFDLDELRNSAANPATSGNNSRPGTLTKSLANELQSRLRHRREGGEQDEEERHTPQQGEESDEEYIETIITASRRRKVGSRANRGQNQIMLEDELKEYADAYTQHDALEFSKSTMVQTDAPPPPPVATSIEIQTDEEPQPLVPVTVSVEIQTEEQTEELLPEAGPSGTSRSSEEEELSSSIETVRPSTPSSSSSAIDSPPSYENIADDKLRLLQKSHPGFQASHPRVGVHGGIPESVLRDWEHVKKEIGFRCSAIDETIKASTINDGEGRAGPRDRIYNIYNTYVLGHGEGDADKSRAGLVRDIAMVGLGATVVLAAVGIPAWINLSIPEERRYYLANTVVGQHMDGPHGLGPTGKLYHAFWLVFQRVVHNGLFAARRVPHPPT